MHRHKCVMHDVVVIVVFIVTAIVVEVSKVSKVDIEGRHCGELQCSRKMVVDHFLIMFSSWKGWKLGAKDKA